MKMKQPRPSDEPPPLHPKTVARLELPDCAKQTVSRRSSSYPSGICRRTAWIVAFVSLLSLLLLARLGNTAQVTLAWDPSQDPSLAGYRLYSGSQSRSYSESRDTGTATIYTTQDLKDGTYYFAVTAMDRSGQESDYSNEASVTIRAGSVVPVPAASAVLPSSTGADAAGTDSRSEGNSSSPATIGGGTATPSSSVGSSGSSTMPAASTGGGGGGGCFIATAAFGSYVDPHVMTLRAFRDSFLLTNRFGRTFVGWYYAISPAAADVIRENSLLKEVARLGLLPAIAFSYLCLSLGSLPTALLILVSLAVIFYGTGRLLVTFFVRP